jgi:hypothetical protein
MNEISEVDPIVMLIPAPKVIATLSAAADLPALKHSLMVSVSQRHWINPPRLRRS